MHYQIGKRNSLRKRYIRPKTFDAVLYTVGRHGVFTTFGLTLCDPRTQSGEGYDFQLSIAPEDVNDPLMAALIARIYAMMSCEARAEFSRLVERETSSRTSVTSI
jgi:hypothetical protein